MSFAALPPALRTNPKVLGLTNALSTSRAKNRELAKLADQSLSPVEQTGATQAGAALTGGLLAYLEPSKATMAAGVLGTGAVVVGAVMESPAAVAFGNGLLAPFVAMKVTDLLTRRTT